MTDSWRVLRAQPQGSRRVREEELIQPGDFRWSLYEGIWVYAEPNEEVLQSARAEQFYTFREGDWTIDARNPKGSRLVNPGEHIQKGDFRWDCGKMRWAPEPAENVGCLYAGASTTAFALRTFRPETDSPKTPAPVASEVLQKEIADLRSRVTVLEAYVVSLSAQINQSRNPYEK